MRELTRDFSSFPRFASLLSASVSIFFLFSLDSRRKKCFYVVRSRARARARVRVIRAKENVFSVFNFLVHRLVRCASARCSLSISPRAFCVLHQQQSVKLQLPLVQFLSSLL